MTYEIPGSQTLSTAEKVIYLREQYPESLAIDIARSIGVSRERIRQILRKLGLESNMQVRLRGRLKVFLPCSRSGCKESRKTTKTKYCSIECWMLDSNRYCISCAYCGKVRRVSNSRYSVNILRGYRNYFCNRACFRDWRIGKSLRIIKNTRSLPERIED